MANRNPKLSLLQISLLLLPLYLIFPIIFYFGEKALDFAPFLVLLICLAFLFLRIYTGVPPRSKPYRILDPMWTDYFTNTPLKRQIFVFTMGTIGLILWIFVFFWSQYEFQGKQVFIREKCKEFAQEAEKTLDPSGKINYNILNTKYDSCLTTEKTSFVEFYSDIFLPINDKQLEAQKKGKSKMIETGKINIPQEVLFSLIEK